MTLGIAWFGALASLTPYRSWFLGLAVLALARSYWVTYSSRWRGLNGTTLRGYRPRLHEVVLWLVTVLVGLLALFPYYNPFLSMSGGSS